MCVHQEDGARHALHAPPFCPPGESSHQTYRYTQRARIEVSADVDEPIGADLSCQRAQLADGQSVLELGCGWGSMSLYMAARYPKSKITAVSNSKTQKELIDSRAKQRGLTNLVSTHLLLAS